MTRNRIECPHCESKLMDLAHITFAKCVNCGNTFHTDIRIGRRSLGSWKYNILKRWKRKAISFRAESVSHEQRMAWESVINWINSHIEVNRYYSDQGTIRIRDD